MGRYAKGDKVEVLNSNGTLEDSWHPALIVGGYEDVYIVVYDGGVNRFEEDWVLAKYVRPRPPVVEFSNWSRGDLVHVYDNFAWKLATVMRVTVEKQFLVHVVGSMQEEKRFLVRVVGSMQDLHVGSGWIRVRHYWQGDRWIVVGKGPSNSDVKAPCARRNMISDSHVHQWNTSVSVPTTGIKRNAPSTVNQTEARVAKISRTAERTSPCTRNPTEPSARTGMRLRLISKHKVFLCPAPAITTHGKTQHEEQEASCSSSVGSCSINTNTTSGCQSPKHAELHCDDSISDAESSIKPAPKPRNIVRWKREAAVLDRPSQHQCSLILRFRLPDPSIQGVLL